MNENLINSLSTNDDKSDNIQNEQINPSGNSNYKTIINQITEILNKYKVSKQKEDIACEEVLTFLKTNNINFSEIKDVDKSTIIQKYCNNKEFYYLNCMLLCMEKLLDEKERIPYLLNEDISKMNIFEMSSEIGELKIFRTLKKYLKDNQDILKHLIDSKDGKSNVFHVAADKNKIMSLLFFYSFYNNNIAYLNIKNKSSWTPLHIACYRGYYEFVQYLVNLGVDIDCKDVDGKTPIFYAVQSNSARVVKFLILSGANKNIKDNKNKKVIEYTKDRVIYDLLEDKNFFRIAFQCETQYQSLKNHHRNILMIILLIFMSIFHLFLIIKYKSSDFAKKCYDKNFPFELFLLAMNIIFQILGLIIYILFQVFKLKKTNNSNDIKNNNYNFCIKENGIEYYDIFFYNENICVRCRRVKEMNTQHCIACDICIDNFDHHCFFLNCCIYKNNKIYFKLFLVEILITVLINLLTSFVFFIDFIKYPKIYYGVIYNDEDFDKNGFYDFIIYFLDIIYFSAALYFILASIIPFIVNLISKKKTHSIKNNKNSDNSCYKSNSPLLPINGNQV